METYDAMRHFADSWGLVGMMAVFLIVVVRVVTLRRRTVRDAAEIPFKDYDGDDRPGGRNDREEAPEHSLYRRDREETR